MKSLASLTVFNSK